MSKIMVVIVLLFGCQDSTNPEIQVEKKCDNGRIYIKELGNDFWTRTSRGCKK